MTPLKNGLFYGLGLAALVGASLRHRIGGYRNPTDFSPDDWPKAIAHVIDIVADWRRHLDAADGRLPSLAGLDVLELGPGATLGTGVLLVGLGARSYRAVDAFALADHTPAAFYRVLADAELPDEVDRVRLREAADALDGGLTDPVAYVIDPDFDIVRAAQGKRFDLIVSNAAFEHFDDIDRVLAHITQVARPGATLVAGVDFQTHTRGVRGSDPNSIYRFSPDLYRSLAFPGQPNRCRPADYLRSLERLGWIDAECRAVAVADEEYRDWSTDGLHEAYRDDGASMDVLTGMVLARMP
ncbi:MULTISPECIES: class I SAM-dependent methyltransferase [Methylobacterium]|uniref:Methyltransferase type 11 domain-containing protein n=1 Tax=Methylobacterium thuringiense TaxID=1003091 RepID=A0ABQ4TJH6_9HYPH|nr:MULTISPECIES: methyltransferase domain-containing protein [Methylobacterium]TXN24289.1 methyltransferase domain-containing protein [Methylobacterium sp. WL9]GJE53825.1 hypothetical protein EKPJFOCH_0293 [Methylobacterium thuringiense]